VFEVERLKRILEFLNERNTMSVKMLAQKLYVSEATVRRDLNELERQGQVKRIHGGAVLVTGNTQEVPLYLRERQNTDVKEILAYRAISYIQNGQVIFMDASSTVQRMVPHLASFQNLTIITNGLKTAQELSNLSHNVYCTGGLQLHNSAAYVGPFAERMVREFNADLFFFSSRGLALNGMITDSSVEETQIRRIMFEQSDFRVFLCDSSKFNTMYSHNLCHIRQTDAVLADKDILQR